MDVDGRERVAPHGPRQPRRRRRNRRIVDVDGRERVVLHRWRRPRGHRWHRRRIIDVDGRKRIVPTISGRSSGGRSRARTQCPKRHGTRGRAPRRRRHRASAERIRSRRLGRRRRPQELRERVGHRRRRGGAASTGRGHGGPSILGDGRHGAVLHASGATRTSGPRRSRRCASRARGRRHRGGRTPRTLSTWHHEGARRWRAANRRIGRTRGGRQRQRCDSRGLPEDTVFRAQVAVHAVPARPRRTGASRHRLARLDAQLEVARLGDVHRRGVWRDPKLSERVHLPVRGGGWRLTRGADSGLAGDPERVLAFGAADLDPLLGHLLVGDLEPRLAPLTLDDHSAGPAGSTSIGRRGRHGEPGSRCLLAPTPSATRNAPARLRRGTWLDVEPKRGGETHERG
ncbi:hypothetical protein MYXA107069_22685 [Myxococcus xanthus]|nr:hypothetical protein MyxoNM_29970 [Myxococcus xanthus]